MLPYFPGSSLKQKRGLFSIKVTFLAVSSHNIAYVYAMATKAKNETLLIFSKLLDLLLSRFKQICQDTAGHIHAFGMQ